MNRKKIIFFDGICNFCNGIVDFIWKNNSKRNLYYSSLQSSYAKKKFNKIGISEIQLNTIYFFDGNKIYTKSSAVFRILLNLDKAYPVFGKIGLLIPKFISNFFYDIIARYRYRIMGIRKTCRVPNKDEKSFFLQ
tara:strand:+ start:1640 stop:2044 length:405 start_codon:yes stop_codon:yes gene_type:complete